MELLLIFNTLGQKRSLKILSVNDFVLTWDIYLKGSAPWDATQANFRQLQPRLVASRNPKSSDLILLPRITGMSCSCFANSSVCLSVGVGNAL